MFRPKPPKALAGREAAGAPTLDAHHMRHLDSFNNDDRVAIPALEREKASLKASLRQHGLPIESRLDLRDRLAAVRKELAATRSRRKDYMLDNSHHIFDYFERKKRVAAGTNKTKTLETFFKVRTQTDDVEAQERSTVKKYLNNIDAGTLSLADFARDRNRCPYCTVGELVPVDHEGILVCNRCSRSMKYLVEHEKPSYKEPPKEVCFYAYKRINHFREILAQFQAKETTQIPDEVLNSIKCQVKKERIGLEQLTNSKAKEILKKLGHNKYYEHIPFIKDKLGIRPPIMSPELEDTLCNLFMEIQAPYAKYCPDDRVNFLNYYYTVYKLCELLDQREFLPFFPMLKDREKRIEQDEIWQKICNELDWEFVPTI